MKPLIDIAKECGIQFCESDVSRDIISRRQLENIVLASIEQHQKDALDVVPCAWEVLLLDSDTAHLYYDKNDPGFVDDMTNNDDAIVTPLYPAATVSALQARIAELEKALGDAATSLKTISNLAGVKTYGYPPVDTLMGTFVEVRGYANSRYQVAIDAARKESK